MYVRREFVSLVIAAIGLIAAASLPARAQDILYVGWGRRRSCPSPIRTWA
jgi:hypothetical protein